MATQTLYKFTADLKDLMALQTEIDKAKTKLAGLGKQTDEYKKQAGKLKNLNKSFKEQSDAIKGADNSMNKLNSTGNRLIKTFQSAAVAIAAAFAVRAIAGSIRGVVESFTTFEAQMAAVKAISGATGEEFKLLESRALSLGASTVFTATQVGQLQEEFARLGFTTDEIDAATESTLDLAAATGESLAKSAQIAGSTLRAFGMDAELTKNVTDIMAASFTDSALNLDRFTESMKFVAPVARATGFTLEETTAMLANLADNGLAGSISGNALKNIMLKLGDANSKLSKKLGRTVSGMPQLVEAMRELADGGFSATEAVDLLDKRSAPAFLALINNIEGLEKSVETLNNAEGAVTRMAAVRLDTLQGDFTILKSASEGLSIALGDKFDISLRNTIFSLTEFIQSITGSERALTIIQRTVQALMAVLVGLGTRLALIGGKSILGGIRALSTAFSGLSLSAARATIAQQGLRAAFAATPWGAIITAITTIAAAFFTMGEEMSEAEMKQKRLNDAMAADIADLADLQIGSKKRAEQMRKFKDEYGEVIGLIDIELATQKELQELKDLSIKQEEDQLKLIEKNAEIESLEEEMVLEKEKYDQARKLHENREAYLDKARKNRKGSVKMGTDTFMIAQDIANNAKRTVLREKKKKEELKALKEEAQAYKDKLSQELTETKVYQRLKLDGEDTFRKKKRDFYNKELQDFRDMKGSQKALAMKAKYEELEAEMTIISQFRNAQAAEEGLSGEPLEQAKLQTDRFREAAKEMGVDVNDSSIDIAKLNIELTVMRDFLQKLDSSYIPSTGKKVKVMAESFSFALNKIKDFNKALGKLMDDLMGDSFGKSMAQLTEKRDEAIRDGQENLRLVTANLLNMEALKDQGTKKEIQQLIKTNKSKYNVIKQLSYDEFKLISEGEKGLKDSLKNKEISESQYNDKVIQLKELTYTVLDGMMKEDEDKQQTNKDYLLQIEQTYQHNLAKIKSQAKIDAIDQGKQLTDLEIEAEYGRQMDLIQIRKDGDRIVIKTLFQRLKEEKAARDEALKQKELVWNQDETRELNALKTAYGKKLMDEEEYQRQKKAIEDRYNTLRTQATNENNQANVDATAQTLQQIQQIYNSAFDSLSMFMTNRWELEKQDITERREQRSDDLNTEMERELEALEGNQAAQEDIREHYALLQEANEEKKQQEIRKVQLKQFRMEKANSIIQAIINGALAMTKVSAQTGVATFAFSPLIAALTAAQVAVIASQKFVGKKGGIIPDETFADGGMVVGPGHDKGGVKFSVGGRVAELEGGEAVINKRSTAMFREQLSAMNVAGGGVRFADGGITPGTSNSLQSVNVGQDVQMERLASSIVNGINDKTVTVSEVDITSTQENVSISELTSNIF